ncbi:hypothetical protein CAC42_1052 [Sphaceloma murrayae]|uniref:Uncharacterized protein n=1 Tax=Sphaceloma murrayae TaxID=2082308 RepID=A0A2K1R264_9PEZI|nr:hypothetical protein CAC42_1052 [Sphaceloma murrayae]
MTIHPGAANGKLRDDTIYQVATPTTTQLPVVPKLQATTAFEQRRHPVPAPPNIKRNGRRSSILAAPKRLPLTEVKASVPNAILGDIAGPPTGKENEPSIIVRRYAKQTVFDRSKVHLKAERKGRRKGDLDGPTSQAVLTPQTSSEQATAALMAGPTPCEGHAEPAPPRQVGAQAHTINIKLSLIHSPGSKRIRTRAVQVSSPEGAKSIAPRGPSRQPEAPPLAILIPPPKDPAIRLASRPRPSTSRSVTCAACRHANSQGGRRRSC